MGTFSRWSKYAKAKLDDTLSQANKELDRREAEREAGAADAPWLRDDADTPSLEDTAARIRRELEEQQRAAGQDPDAADESGTTPGPDEAAGDPSDPPGRSDPWEPAEPPDQRTAPAGDANADGPPEPPATASPAPRDPTQVAADAQLAQARLQIEANQREATERLAAMRRELGVDDPAPPDQP